MSEDTLVAGAPVKIKFKNILEKYPSQEARDSGEIPEVIEWEEEVDITEEEARLVGFEPVKCCRLQATACEE